MTTATQTQAQVNGDKPTYEPKFLPKLHSIPVIKSVKQEVYTHLPQAESLSKYVGDQLSTAFKYTDNTPIQGALIRLDTLAASGLETLEKQVPIVNSPPKEILKKTKVDKLLGFITHYYCVAIDFFYNLVDQYKDVFDSVVLPVLDRIEIFLGTKSDKGDTKTDRTKRIYTVVIENVDNTVAPLSSKSKETISSIYSQILPLAQYPVTLFTTQKDKATESVSPYVHEVNHRLTKAESAAKDAWIQTKPDISGPNSVIPTLKSGVFAVLTFGYTVVYPEKPKEEAKKHAANKTEEQTNGLVSGVDLSDGDIKRRPNGAAA